MEEENKEVVEAQETEITSSDSTDIKISNDVVASIAGVAVSEVQGVYSMAGGGLAEVFSGKKNLSKGIKVEVGEKETKIDVNIIVEYGVRIPDVTTALRKRIVDEIDYMTGINIFSINVNVRGIDMKKE